MGDDAVGSTSYLTDLSCPRGERGKGNTAEEPRMKPEFEPVDNSPSVSVSVSSPGGRERLAGLAERLKMRTVARPPSSLLGKWTFLWTGWSMLGVDGAERARRWPCGWVDGTRDWGGNEICGEEDDDLSEDLRGFPLESRMGVDVVRVTLGRGAFCAGEVAPIFGGGRGANGGESGDERGKGTLAVAFVGLALGEDCLVRSGAGELSSSSSGAVDMERRKELFGLSLRAGGML